MFRRFILLGICLLIMLSPVVVFAEDVVISVQTFNESNVLFSENEVTYKKGETDYLVVEGKWDMVYIPGANNPDGSFVIGDIQVSPSAVKDPSIVESRLTIRVTPEGFVRQIGDVVYSKVATSPATITQPPAGSVFSPAPTAQGLAQAGNGAAAGTVAPKVAAPAVAVAKCGDSKGIIDPKCDLKQNLEKLYNVSVPVIVLLAFLAVIYAGYIYITSFGQSERITEAKNWLLAAVGGLALILLVPVILKTLDIIKVQLPGS